jgi:hypothetical protein
MGASGRSISANFAVIVRRSFLASGPEVLGSTASPTPPVAV